MRRGGDTVRLLGGAGAEDGPATAGIRSYARARAALDAGIAALGGLEALQATRTVLRRLSGDWVGSGQHPRPWAAAAPTLTVPPANGRTGLVSFIDYSASRFHEEAVESDLTGDAVTRVNTVTQRAGFETVTYREERPFYRPHPEVRRPA